MVLELLLGISTEPYKIIIFKYPTIYVPEIIKLNRWVSMEFEQELLDVMEDDDEDEDFDDYDEDDDYSDDSDDDFDDYDEDDDEDDI